MKKILLGLVLIMGTLFTQVWAEDNPRAVIILMHGKLGTDKW